jgi:hypothetical protein
VIARQVGIFSGERNPDTVEDMGKRAIYYEGGSGGDNEKEKVKEQPPSSQDVEEC